MKPLRRTHRIGLATVLFVGTSAFACTSKVEAVESDDAALSDLPAAIEESALDRTANPCADFFEFACGGFMRSTKLENPYDRKELYGSAVDDVNEAAIDEVIGGMVTAPATDEERRVERHMNACMTFETHPPGPGQLTSLLEKELAPLRAARARGKSALLGEGILRTYLPQGPSNPFFAVWTLPNRNQGGDAMALVVIPAFGRLVATDADELGEKLSRFYPTMSDADRAARAELILRIETAAQDAIGTREFTEHFLGREGLARIVPSVDWDQVLPILGAGRATRILGYQLEALGRMDALFASLGVDELEAYLEYYVIAHWDYQVIPFEGSVPKAECNTHVAFDLPGILQPRFVDTVLGRKNTAAAMAMTRKILGTFEKRLETAPFVDPQTRSEAITKARAMKVAPLELPPDSYADIALGSSFIDNKLALARRRTATDLGGVDGPPPAPGRDDYYTGASASYSATTNRFTILPGIAHGRFFGGAAATPAHNFGALGFVIGHEVTHGFDDVGRHFDDHGADRDWWTPGTAAAFETRAGCFVAQYSAFAVEGVLDPATGRPRHVNGRLTLGENIADNGGIRTAFQTAKEFFPKSHDVSGLSPAQQFFVAAGQTQCKKIGKSALEGDLKNNPHSPPKARVNVLLSNFDEFAHAFSCKAGDPMVAERACVLW